MRGRATHTRNGEAGWWAHKIYQNLVESEACRVPPSRKVTLNPKAYF
jgi:hypothetical protein